MIINLSQTTTPHATTVLRPFFRDHPDASVPGTLWCKGRLTEADTLTIRLGATPSGPTSAHLYRPPIFFNLSQTWLETVMFYWMSLLHLSG